MKEARPIAFRPLHDPAAPDYRRAMELYSAAFPRCERRTEEDHAAALNDPLFHAWGIYEGDSWAGLLFWWDSPEGVYIEHLAVAPELRGHAIGSRALAAIEAPRTVLEIDPPEDETARRRLAFYRRCGFVESPIDYLHPSFSRPFEPHRLVLMGRPEAPDEASVERLRRFVAERVLRYSDHAPAEGQARP